MIVVIQHPQKKVIHIGTRETECRHWLHAHARHLTHSFLTRNPINRLFAASDYFRTAPEDLTPSQIADPEVYNFMYYTFLKYFTIESNLSKKEMQTPLSITKIDIKEYNH